LEEYEALTLVRFSGVGLKKVVEWMGVTCCSTEAVEDGVDEEGEGVDEEGRRCGESLA